MIIKVNDILIKFCPGKYITLRLILINDVIQRNILFGFSE